MCGIEAGDEPTEIKKAQSERITTEQVALTKVVKFSDMAYNRKGYLQRAKVIQEVTAQYYEPENHAKCYKVVWKRQIFPQFGIGYRAFLRYVKVKIEPVKPSEK